MAERKYTIKQIQESILNGFIELNKQIGKSDLTKKDMRDFGRAMYGINKMAKQICNKL